MKSKDARLLVRKTPDGRVIARRKDGLPLTPEDKEDARELSQGRADDPILSPDEWFQHFREFHHKVTVECPDFDYTWVKQNRPHLVQAMKAKENELDGLQDTRLSEVMAIMTEWRKLVLEAAFAMKKAQSSVQPSRTKTA